MSYIQSTALSAMTQRATEGPMRRPLSAGTRAYRKYKDENCAVSGSVDSGSFVETNIRRASCTPQRAVSPHTPTYMLNTEGFLCSYILIRTHTSIACELRCDRAYKVYTRSILEHTSDNLAIFAGDVYIFMCIFIYIHT